VRREVNHVSGLVGEGEGEALVRKYVYLLLGWRMRRLEAGQVVVVVVVGIRLRDGAVECQMTLRRYPKVFVLIAVGLALWCLRM